MTNVCSLLFLNQPVLQEEEQQATPAEQLVIMDVQQPESGDNSDNETVQAAQASSVDYKTESRI